MNNCLRPAIRWPLLTPKLWSCWRQTLKSLNIESLQIQSLLPVKFATDTCSKDMWISIGQVLYDGMYVLLRNLYVDIFEFYCMYYGTDHSVVAERDTSVSLCLHTSYPWQNTVPTWKIQLIRRQEKPLAGAMRSHRKNNTSPVLRPFYKIDVWRYSTR
jgi:hypothetical protein